MKKLSTFLMAAGVLLLGSAAMAGEPTVSICHIPPGNPGNSHSITVGPSAVPAHLAHGDQLVSEEVCDGVDNDCDGMSTTIRPMSDKPARSAWGHARKRAPWCVSTARLNATLRRANQRTKSATRSTTTATANSTRAACARRSRAMGTRAGRMSWAAAEIRAAAGR
jgi:hypothetical protein